MKKIIMTIGLPFSGKSTLAKKYASEGYKIINRDDLLDSIINSSEFNKILESEIKLRNTDLNNSSAIFDIKNELAIKMLSAKVKEIVLNSDEHNFFYDGLNIGKKTREPIIGLKDENIAVEAIYLKVPNEEIKRRAALVFKNNDRSGKFNDVRNIDLFISKLEEPRIDEGFSDLKVLDFKNELKQEFKLN
jgi:dephospho-CoA kinase